MKRILILSSEKAGGGHRSLAQAIKNQLNHQYQVDTYDQLLESASDFYLLFHNYFPRLFNLLYPVFDNPFGALIIKQLFSPKMRKKLRKIDWDKYDLIISVHHVIALQLAGITNKPLIVFVADPVSVHQIWISPQADLFLVGTKQAKKTLIKKGINKEKVVVTGFPVRQQFLNVKPPKKRKKQFTVFLGGSGYGVAKTKAILRHLKNTDIKVIVVCGRNKILKATLAFWKNIQTYGFVENIAKLMSQADLIVAKPGPNLLFESIILKIPFLATTIPPSQEKGNLELIKQKQIGFYKPQAKQTAQLIKQLAKNPEKLTKLKSNLKKLAQEHQSALKNINLEVDKLLANNNHQ